MKPSTKSVTIWDFPGRKLERSQYGDNLTYQQWCEKEVERMNGCGGRVVLSEQEGMIAICRTS